MPMTMHVSSQAIVAARPPVLKSIWAGIRFGAPGKNCQGSGICEVFELANHHAQKKRCNCWQAGWIKGHGDNYMEIRFLNRDMAECTRRKYFQGEHFLVEEDLVLPKFLRQSLGLTVKTLRSGAYPIRYYRHYTSIIVRLKRTYPDF